MYMQIYLTHVNKYNGYYGNYSDDCRTLTGDSPDITPMLCQAMEALQDRPVLFR